MFLIIFLCWLIFSCFEVPYDGMRNVKGNPQCLTNLANNSQSGKTQISPVVNSDFFYFLEKRISRQLQNLISLLLSVSLTL